MARYGALVRLGASGAACALAACAAPPEPTLLEEARAALIAVVDQPVTVRFDDSGAVALAEQGLLCGGKVTFADGRGDDAGWQPYFYRREQGVALPARDPQLYEDLKRECERASGR